MLRIAKGLKGGIVVSFRNYGNYVRTCVKLATMWELHHNHLVKMAFQDPGADGIKDNASITLQWAFIAEKHVACVNNLYGLLKCIVT